MTELLSKQLYDNFDTILRAKQTSLTRLREHNFKLQALKAQIESGMIEHGLLEKELRQVKGH